MSHFTDVNQTRAFGANFNKGTKRLDPFYGSIINFTCYRLPKNVLYFSNGFFGILRINSRNKHITIVIYVYLSTCSCNNTFDYLSSGSDQFTYF